MATAPRQPSPSNQTEFEMMMMMWDEVSVGAGLVQHVYVLSSSSLKWEIFLLPSCQIKK